MSNWIAISDWCQDDSLAKEFGLVGCELAQIATDEFQELCLVRRDGTDALNLHSLDDFLAEYRLNGNNWWQDRQDKYIAINSYGDEVNTGPENTWIVYRCSYSCQREMLAKQMPYIRLANQAEQRQYKASGSNEVYYSPGEMENQK